MKLSLTLVSLLSVSALAASFTLPENAPTTAAVTSAAPIAYAVDAGHSSVLFKTRHNGVANFYGRFNELSGEVAYDAANPTASRVSLEIQADSVDTNSEGRDKHLRNADFFSVQEFPTITFESTKVAQKGDDLEVTGDLSFHGVTKSVQAVVEVTGTGEARGAKVAGFEARFTIDMADYGVSFVKKNPTALGPEVHLTVSLECKAQ